MQDESLHGCGKMDMLRHFASALVALLVLTSQTLANFVMELASGDTGAVPLVIGGAPANPTEWPASLRFNASGSMCSSTVIGPRVIITAAHCINDRATGTVRIGAFTTTVRCDHHPQYAIAAVHDVALCLADRDVALPDSGRYERINASTDRPKAGALVVLQGYGCRRDGGGGDNGVLYEGLAAVAETGGPDSYIKTLGGAALCFGDSGGSAFIKLDEFRRFIVGINSRGNIKTESYLTAVAHKPVMDFVATLVSTENTVVCGVNAPSKICHE